MKKVVNYKSVKVIDISNFKRLGVTGDYGVSVYKNVLIVWDEDHDARIITLIDQIEEKWEQLVNLAVVHEHEGSVIFIWNYHVPFMSELQECGEVIVEEDAWHVHESRVIGE